MGIAVDFAPVPRDEEHHATRLRSIKPATVLPEEYTARSQALTALKRIESLEIRGTVRRNGHRYYVIDIYYKLSHSRIPTNRNAPKPGAQGRRPDVTVERRLSEVGNLRDEMYYHAHNGHGSLPCSFCKDLVKYVLYGPAKPRTLLRWLDGTDHIQQTLTQFLSEILSLTTKVKACGGNECQGQENIPVLLETFLFHPEMNAPF